MNWHNPVITKIRNARLPHANFETCREDLSARLDACNPGELIYIYGPTRVGKTELLKTAMELKYGKLNQESDHLPYAIVTASNASTAGQFSTRGLTRRALRAIYHPIHSHARTTSMHDVLKQSLSRKTEDELRDDLVDMLCLREVQCMGFDEMQNTRFVPGGSERASWFIDSLKCAAADANAIFVIVGTYELLPVIDLCPQVVGRSDAIHFPRYKGDIQQDVNAWDEILDGYSRLIPFKGTSESLRDWNECLFKGSYGCIGLLDKWLRSAVSVASHRGSPYLTEAFLNKTYREDRELSVIANSIEQSEMLLTAPRERVKKTPRCTHSSKREKVARKRRPFQKKVQRYTGDERMAVQ